MWLHGWSFHLLHKLLQVRCPTQDLCHLYCAIRNSSAFVATLPRSAWSSFCRRFRAVVHTVEYCPFLRSPMMLYDLTSSFVEWSRVACPSALPSRPFLSKSVCGRYFFRPWTPLQSILETATLGPEVGKGSVRAKSDLLPGLGPAAQDSAARRPRTVVIVCCSIFYPKVDVVERGG